MGCSWPLWRHVHALLIHSTPVHLLWVSEGVASFIRRGVDRAYVLLQTLQYQNVYCDVTHLYTTFSNGSLGSRIDEERSEMR